MNNEGKYGYAAKNSGGGYRSKERNSNLELLRIIAMLVIIAHHFVVNSGIQSRYGDTITANMMFLQLWGMWGKTAINAFVMITGYFMCTSRLTWRRFAKMYLVAKFYSILFFGIFLVAGYETISFKRIFNLLFENLRFSNTYFTPAFFTFYLFIPFLNPFIEKMGRNLWKPIVLLLGMFTVTGTFFFNDGIFHHVFWYATLYLLAAWFRLYPNSWTESAKFTGLLFAVSVFLSYASVSVLTMLGNLIGKGHWLGYYMVADSNKLLAFLVGMSMFLYFKNMKMRNHKWINTIAGTTFGVLQIHANSDAMRQWLWRDLLNVPAMYDLPFAKLVLTSVVVMICVFAVYSVLDMIRIHYIERPFLGWLNKNTEKIENTTTLYLRTGARLLSKAGEFFQQLL